MHLRVASVLAVVATVALMTPSVALGTEPPSSVISPAIEGEATVDSPLKGKAGEWEGTAPINYQWQWLICDAEGLECEPIPGATEKDRVVRDYDLGGTLRLRVTAINKYGSASKESAATTVVAEPEPPVNTEPPSLVGTMNVGEEIVVDSGVWTHYPQSFEFQWQECDVEGENCEDLEGEVDASIVLPDSVESKRIRVQVTAANRGGEVMEESAVGEAVGAMLPPVNDTPPTVGHPVESKALKAQEGEWEGGRPMSFTFQWIGCNSSGGACAEIGGATSQSYIPTAEDVGKKLKIEVTATNDAGSKGATSNPSLLVEKSEPWYADAVEIEGEAAEGVELAADLSALRGSEPITVEYEWQRCFEDCTPISGATGASYTPDWEDAAHRIRVEVIATNGLGEAVRSSPYSAPVEPAETEGEPRPADFPALEGLPQVGQTLTATDGEWRGAGEISTAVRWQRCFEGTEFCEDIEEATGNTLELDSGDVGERLRAVITATNEEGFEEAASRLSSPILPSLNTVAEFGGEVSIEEVLEGALEAGAPVVALEWDHAGVGAFSGGVAGTMPYDVLEQLEDAGLNPEELKARSMSVSGEFTPIGLWGGLPTQTTIEHAIEGWHHPPALPPEHPEPEPEPAPEGPPPPTPLPLPEDVDEPTEPTIGEPGLSLPIVSWAELLTSGWWDCRGEDCEEYNPNHWPGTTAREMLAQFEWGISQEDMFRELYEHSVALAFEFDVKLVNPKNDDGKVGINCSDSEVNDFYVTKRDDMMWKSSIPSEAGVYWDTDFLDSCKHKDLSFGVYHPEALERGETYETFFQFEHAGDAWTSDVEWHAELLERENDECDYSPWCVNVEPFYDDYRLPQVLIPWWYHWDVPRCYEYKFRDGKMGAHECWIIS